MAGGADAIGLGAMSNRDGQNALIHNAESCCCNIPVEVQETKLPVLIERYELRTGSGGPGKFRGGLGIRKDFRTLAPATAIAMMERTSASPVEGICGGRRGAFNQAIFEYDKLCAKSRGKQIANLDAGSTVSVQGGGGAGWGDPLERDAALVLADVCHGYVSPAEAERDYGVIVRSIGDDFELDQAASEVLRNRLHHGATEGVDNKSKQV
jgi:N-methylhydantoinase B